MYKRQVYGFEAPIYFDESAPLALSEDDLYAKACIVMEATTGSVLFAHEADTQLYPASTTKIMTLLLALERGGLNQEITIPACAADVPKDSSLVPVYEGEQMPFLDLLYGLIIRSGNDAANAVAELCAGSDEDVDFQPVEDLHQQGEEYEEHGDEQQGVVLGS